MVINCVCAWLVKYFTAKTTFYKSENNTYSFQKHPKNDTM